MVTHEHLQTLAPHEIARNCLEALVVLTSTSKRASHDASDIESYLEKHKVGTFLGSLVRNALTWLSEQGFVTRLNQHEVYMLTFQGEVAHVILAYERHALA